MLAQETSPFAKQRDLDLPVINVTGIRHRIVNITVGRGPPAICAAVIKYMICYAVFTRWYRKLPPVMVAER
jgi:hypothetical protein